MSMYLRKVEGHPSLRKDNLGIVHVIDKDGQQRAKTDKEVSLLKQEINELKAMLKQVLEKQQ